MDSVIPSDMPRTGTPITIAEKDEGYPNHSRAICHIWLRATNFPFNRIVYKLFVRRLCSQQ